MTPILRLIWTYFTATPLMRGLVSLGLACAGLGMVGYLYYPPWTLGTGMRSDMALWLQSAMLFAPWIGLILLFFASSLLPAIVERFALGRMILVLPGARVALLASAVATAGIIALLTAFTGMLAFFYYPTAIKPENVFGRALLVVFADISIMYVAVWIVGKTRGIWLLLGSLLIAVGITTPLALIGLPSGVPAYVWLGIAVWVAFALLLLFGGRLKQAFGRSLTSPAQFARRALPGAAYASGTELQLLLGTTQPWLIAFGQAVPILAAAWLFRQHSVWLFFLTLFSAIGGAITSTAAARSRVLWLRHGWTRAELFRRVEAAYWRYNAYPLGVLLLLYVAMGSYRDVSTPRLAFGVPLLVLGSVASLYLGLLMTRGLHWLEAALGILTMIVLMQTAVAIGDQTLNRVMVVELELAVLVLAVTYRTIASVRWNALDWMVCRNGPATRAAG